MFQSVSADKQAFEVPAYGCDGRPVFLRNPKRNKRGQVAQLVEQRTENPRVAGSIPALTTTQS